MLENDKVLETYFDDLRRCNVLSGEVTTEIFLKIRRVNNELIQSLWANTEFWKTAYDMWKVAAVDNKVSSKLSINHSGDKQSNLDISKQINNFFTATAECEFTPNFCSLSDFLSLELHRTFYFNVYQKLSRELKLKPSELALYKELDSLRAQLVRSNLRLVVKFAKEYKDKGVAFTDLIQEGNIGLMRAIDKFKPEIGRFSTYAGWWVKQACIRQLKRQSRIHIPTHMQEKLMRMRKQKANYEEVSPELDTETYERLLGMSLQPLSLDMPTNASADTDDPEELSNMIYDIHQALPDEEVEQSLLVQAIDEQLDKLEPLDKDIVILRLGLQGNKVHTLKQIADLRGVNRETIRKREIIAMAQLKDSCDSLKAFWE